MRKVHFSHILRNFLWAVILQCADAERWTVGEKQTDQWNWSHVRNCQLVISATSTNERSEEQWSGDSPSESQRTTPAAVYGDSSLPSCPTSLHSRSSMPQHSACSFHRQYGRKKVDRFSRWQQPFLQKKLSSACTFVFSRTHLNINQRPQLSLRRGYIPYVCKFTRPSSSVRGSGFETSKGQALLAWGNHNKHTHVLTNKNTI